MTCLAALLGDGLSAGALLVAVGGLLLYVASRAAADALAGADPDRPGWRAAGHCLPIAAVALMCLLPAMGRPRYADGRPPMAVGLIFSSSVACLTLVLGIVTYLSPLTSLPPSRRAWPFVFATALLALVAGMTGQLSWLPAIMLALLGAAVMNVWVAGDRNDGATTTSSGPEPPPLPIPPKLLGLRGMEFLLAIVLAFLGGWSLLRGVTRIEQLPRSMSEMLLACGVCGPLLALPVLGNVARIAERGRPDSAAATLVAIVLLNLCAILPTVVMVHYVPSVVARVRPHLAVVAAPTTAPTTATATTVTVQASELFEHSAAMPYPMVVWRIDTLALVVIGFGLIPWAMGRWALGRAESVALIISYALYLALIALLSPHWG